MAGPALEEAACNWKRGEERMRRDVLQGLPGPGLGHSLQLSATPLLKVGPGPSTSDSGL
jgi:hypothetical protein